MSLSGRDFLRYSRNLLLADVGEAGQEKLLNSRVLVVGLGGLGCPVALYLAAAGVGQLSLCDADVVELTNLQRQILYREADCGRAKVESARDALLALNPNIDIRTFPQKVDTTVWGDGDRSYHLVLDCTDNIAARHWLNRRCYSLGVPLISAAALGWEGQLVTLDFARHRSPCLACALPEGQVEPLANCANTGIIGPVLGAMGSLQALAAIKYLLGFPVDHAVMQRHDGRRDQWLSLALGDNPDCPVCQQKLEE